MRWLWITLSALILLLVAVYMFHPFAGPLYSELAVVAAASSSDAMSPSGHDVTESVCPSATQPALRALAAAGEAEAFDDSWRVWFGKRPWDFTDKWIIVRFDAQTGTCIATLHADPYGIIG